MKRRTPKHAPDPRYAQMIEKLAPLDMPQAILDHIRDAAERGVPFGIYVEWTIKALQRPRLTLVSSQAVAPC